MADDQISSSTNFELLQCCGCQEAVLRRTFEYSIAGAPDYIIEEVGGTEFREVRRFPPAIVRHPPKWRSNLPRDSGILLEEIYRSLDSESRLLPVLGARTLVDMMILEKVGDVGTFEQKLKALESGGFISSDNRAILCVVLEKCSATAHRGHVPSPSEVQAVMDIVENMLQAMYVFPDVAQRLKQSTPPRLRRNSKHV